MDPDDSQAADHSMTVEQHGWDRTDQVALKARVKLAPPAGLSLTLTVPRCRVMISFTIARPSPAPALAAFVPRQNRSNTRSRSSFGTPGPRSETLTRASERTLTTTSSPFGEW